MSFMEDIVVRCFKDSFKRQPEVLSRSLKGLVFGAHGGDKVPNGHVPALYPDLPPPVFGTGFKIFVGFAALAHDLGASESIFVSEITSL